MKIHAFHDNKTILKEIGKRIKDRRIGLNLTQKEVEEESQVSLRTISGFENGENISLDNLISILKSLNLIQDINLLFPETKVDPFDVLKLGHKRKRVSKKIKTKTTWQWGE